MFLYIDTKNAIGPILELNGIDDFMLDSDFSKNSGISEKYYKDYNDISNLHNGMIYM